MVAVVAIPGVMQDVTQVVPGFGVLPASAAEPDELRSAALLRAVPWDAFRDESQGAEPQDVLRAVTQAGLQGAQLAGLDVPPVEQLVDSRALRVWLPDALLVYWRVGLPGLLRDGREPDVLLVQDALLQDGPQERGQWPYAHRQAAEPDVRY